MRSTMQDCPLTVTAILRHGTTVARDGVVVTATADGTRRLGYGQLAERAARLAGALRALGVNDGDRVATFGWNNQEHLEAYLAVPAMGAVLHTLNIRLHPDQLRYVADHAEDRVVIVDASLAAAFAAVLPRLPSVRAVLVTGEGDDATAALASSGALVTSYEAALAAAPAEFDWPSLDEYSAAAMCYTSGTTANPKGVVYSHRSTYLHSMAVCSGNGMALSFADRVLPVVPMFHANAWGLPYGALMAGADLVLPDRFCQPAPLAALLAAERPTVTAAVPTIWGDLVRHLDRHPVDLSALRLVICGGSAVPGSLLAAMDRLGLPVVHAWGMTETSPLGSMARPPRGVDAAAVTGYRLSQGRVLCGVAARLVGDDGGVLASDGVAVGEVEVQGPWVAAGYHRGDDADRFHDGWLRTGDVGTVDELGYLTLTDRAKDVIKSGGEWISSVALENALMGHPAVLEAAVVGVPDERWTERPLAAVVLRDATPAADTAGQLRAWLAERLPPWQTPERWAFVDAVPRTSVGKFDKKAIRARYAEGALAVVELAGPGALETLS